MQPPEQARLRVIRIPEAEGEPIEIGDDELKRIPILSRVFMEADRAYTSAGGGDEAWVVPPTIFLKDVEAEAIISLGLHHQTPARYGPGCLQHQQKFYLLWIEGFRRARAP